MAEAHTDWSFETNLIIEKKGVQVCQSRQQPLGPDRPEVMGQAWLEPDPADGRVIVLVGEMLAR